MWLKTSTQQATNFTSMTTLPYPSRFFTSASHALIGTYNCTAMAIWSIQANLM